MGASYRQYLKRGHMKEWEKPMRAAVRLLTRVRDDMYDHMVDEDQTDNAADTGGLSEVLGVCLGLLEQELP